MDRDADHLRVLAICHYVLAALTALSAIPFWPGLAASGLVLRMLRAAVPPEVPHDLIQQLVRTIFWSLFLLTLLHASIVAYIGWCLARRKRRLLSLVFSGFNLLMVPLGTILGVFTLVVLLRPSVKALFTAPGTGG
jgi:hypothetical protein